MRGLKLVPCFVSTVRKPRNAKNIKEQVDMVTRDIFGTIYRSQEFIIKHLMNGGFVFNLEFGDYKWRFLSGGMLTNCDI